jgi:aspartyl-tRNA synthetase
LRDSTFKVFREALDGKGIVKAINVKGGGSLSRKEVDDLAHFVQNYGAKGLVSAKVKQNGWQSTIQKFISEEEMRAIDDALNAMEDDLLLFVAGAPKVVNQSLANLRLHLGERLGLIPKDQYRFVWILDFPLLEYDETEGRFVAVHHPFTAPKDEDVSNLREQPESVKAKAYDLVLF